MDGRIDVRYERGLLQAVQEEENTAVPLLGCVLCFSAATGERVTVQKRDLDLRTVC